MIVFSCCVISQQIERASIVLKFKKVNFLKLSIHVKRTLFIELFEKDKC